MRGTFLWCKLFFKLNFPTFSLISIIQNTTHVWGKASWFWRFISFILEPNKLNTMFFSSYITVLKNSYLFHWI